MKKKKGSPMQKLTIIVERGFAAVAADIGDIKATMATKADIIRLEERLLSIEQELKGVKQRLADIETQVEKFGSRYKQDIEDLWKHVSAIEKRLKASRS